MIKYFIFTIWPMFYLLNKYKFNKSAKINRNLISFKHSISCSLISSLPLCFKIISNDNIRLPIYYLSTSYFLWDNFYILSNGLWNEYMFIYHHLVSLLALNELYHDNNTNIIIKIFGYAEASNFFNYIVYHMIKKKYPKKILLFTKTLQVIWFTYFRMYLFTPLIYNNLSLIKNKLLACNLGLMYSLGLFLGAKQIIGLISDYKKKIK